MQKKILMQTGRRHGWLMKGGGWVGNLLSPALSSTSVWRRGRRRAVLPFMSQPWGAGHFLESVFPNLNPNPNDGLEIRIKRVTQKGDMRPSGLPFRSQPALASGLS
jgi:hypothetical protein